MTIGTVKFFNAAKGFGFVTPDGESRDVFVPATSLAAAGVSQLKTGQRVSFETKPDAKGPKAIDLKVLPDAPAPKKAKQSTPISAQAGAKLTVYLDSDSEEAGRVLSALRAAGHDPHVIDYIQNPTTKDALKAVSILLQEGDQSLVRKFAPLFHGLRLDDRFISENEFWTAIVEHPSLINGPVVSSATRARICRSEADVSAFLQNGSASGLPPKRKGISQRLAALIAGRAVPSKVAKTENKPKPANTGRAKTSAQQPALSISKKSKSQAAAKKKVKAATKSPKKVVRKHVKKSRRATGK